MKIGILGAGYTGMTIAKYLKEEGHDVSIFEQRSQAGGMCETIDILSTKLEKHYRHIFKSDKDVIELINELGLGDKLIWPSTKMGYLSDNKIYEFGTPISLLKFMPLRFIDKIRFGVNILYIKMLNDYKKLEKYTAEKWLIQHIGEKAYSTIWEPLLISKFGEEKSNVSMSWLWGKIKLRGTSSTKDGEQLGYIEGSYQKLTDSFYKYLCNIGVNFYFDTQVTKISKNNKYTINTNSNSDNNLYEDFDYIISTLDYETSMDVLGKLIKKYEIEKMKRVKYTSARTMLIIANEGISDFYWTNIGDKSIPFGGIIEHTNMIDKKNYNDKHIIYISNYMTEDNSFYNMSENKMFENYIQILNKINPNFTQESVEKYMVFNEKYAQPIIKTNYSDYLLDTKMKEKNLYICTMPQIYPEDRGMNYAIKIGKKVAKEIRGDKIQ